MTYYTMYQMLNCLIRDERNHLDLKKMFREALIDNEIFSDITDDELVVSDYGWCYVCTGYSFENNGIYTEKSEYYPKDLAKILI